MRITSLSLLALPVLLQSSFALADGPAKGTATSTPASKGTTDVTKEGFVAAEKKDEEAKDATEASIGAGGLLATGNSRSLALTGNGSFRLRREQNQLSAILAGNYSRASVGGGPIETTVENIQGRTRYDRFVTKDLALFLALQGRRDRFAGLALRGQVDPGVGYYFLNEAKLLFWGELGYDLLHDIRRDDSRAVKDDAGNQIDYLPKTKTVHSGRAFLGYSNKVNEGVSILFGLEYLQGLSDTKIYRINGDATVNSKIGKGFSIATAFSFRYDKGALPGKQKLDTVTSLNLVYTIL